MRVLFHVKYILNVDSEYIFEIHHLLQQMEAFYVDI